MKTKNNNTKLKVKVNYTFSADYISILLLCLQVITWNSDFLLNKVLSLRHLKKPDVF